MKFLPFLFFSLHQLIIYIMEDFEALKTAMERAKAWGLESEVIVFAIQFAIQSNNPDLTVEDCLNIGLLELDI